MRIIITKIMVLKSIKGSPKKLIKRWASMSTEEIPIICSLGKFWRSSPFRRVQKNDQFLKSEVD